MEVSVERVEVCGEELVSRVDFRHAINKRSKFVVRTNRADSPIHNQEDDELK